RVNAIAPGLIQTRFSEALWVHPEAQQRALAAIPQGRIGQPEDLTGAVLYLAGDAARFTTGAGLVVDGGQTLGGASGADSVDGAAAAIIRSPKPSASRRKSAALPSSHSSSRASNRRSRRPQFRRASATNPASRARRRSARRSLASGAAASESAR